MIAKQGTTVQTEKPSGKGKKAITFPKTCSRSWATCHLLVASGASGKVKALSSGIRKDMIALTCSSTAVTYGS